MSADLHVHSVFSDGCLSPRQLVEGAQGLGLAALAITDHDSLQGVPEAIERGLELGIVVLPGIEISCSEHQDEYHILGYRMDCSYEPLLVQLERIQLERARRAERIVAQLAELGVRLSYSRIREIAGAGVVGRPHIASALVEKGYSVSIRDAFARYLNAGQPGYVPRYRLGVRHGINLIREAGGIPVWAHPGEKFSSARLEELKSLGLMGVEVWHPDHSPEQMLWIADQAARAGLLVTGGSDFHCQQPDYPALGSYLTPKWALAALLSISAS